jgi:hypothetical protein
MTSCSTNTCGVGGWNGPLPGDPDNNSILSATPAFGGIDVSWTYPTTRPEAVAYVQLFRGVLPDFNAAIIIATVGGSFYYDKTTNDQQIQYYYWIKIVSVNGTVGELIGPATAVAQPLINQVILGLTQRIDSGLLAQSLRTEIDKITLLGISLGEETDARTAANNATNTALAQVQSQVSQTLSLIAVEVADRQQNDAALLSEINANATAIVAESVNRVALIQNEADARATAILNEASARIAGLSALQTQMNTLQAASSGDLSELLAVLETEQTARIAGDTAESTARQTLATQMRGAYLGSNPAELTTGLMYTERQARITAEQAIVSSVTALSATVNTANAAITTEATTRASADTALSNQFTTLNSQVNNATTGLPATRASLLANYYTKTSVDSAIATSVLNMVSSTSLATTLAAYATNATLTQNHYTKTATDAAISAATTTLTSNFNTTLAAYPTTATLTANYYTKTAADAAIASATQNLVSSTGLTTALSTYATLAKLSTDHYTKTATDSAISTAVTALSTTVNTKFGLYTPTATLNTTHYTRAQTDTAIATATQSLVSTTALNTALSAYTTTAALTTNYFTKTQTNAAIASATSTLVSNTTLANYTTTAALQTNYFTKTQTNNAISSSVYNLSSAISNDISQVYTELTTYAELNDAKVLELGALYTAKVGVNGLIGGFGIYNDGSEVEAGFDVDLFWVGRTAANKKKPFIIENDQVFIDQAVINQLTFTKLRDESGAVMVENGKLKANYISGRNLELLSGAFEGYVWPAAGLSGFYLGSSGLLLGNANNNRYFQVSSAGDIFAPGFNVQNGTLTINQANVINTLNVAGNAITTTQNFGFSSGLIYPTYDQTTQWTSDPMWVSYPQGSAATIFIVTVIASNQGGGTNIGVRIKRSDGLVIMNFSTSNVSGFTQTHTFSGKDGALTGSYHYVVELFNDWYNGGPWSAPSVSVVVHGVLR